MDNMSLTPALFCLLYLSLSKALALFLPLLVLSLSLSLVHSLSIHLLAHYLSISPNTLFALSLIETSNQGLLRGF